MRGQFLLISFSALRIHTSQSTADILLKNGSFELEERGDIEIKVCIRPLFIQSKSLRSHCLLYFLPFIAYLNDGCGQGKKKERGRVIC